MKVKDKVKKFWDEHELGVKIALGGIAVLGGLIGYTVGKVTSYPKLPEKITMPDGETATLRYTGDSMLSVFDSVEERYYKNGGKSYYYGFELAEPATLDNLGQVGEMIAENGTVSKDYTGFTHFLMFGPHEDNKN